MIEGQTTKQRDYRKIPALLVCKRSGTSCHRFAGQFKMIFRIKLLNFPIKSFRSKSFISYP